MMAIINKFKECMRWQTTMVLEYSISVLGSNKSNNQLGGGNCFALDEPPFCNSRLHHVLFIN